MYNAVNDRLQNVETWKSSPEAMVDMPDGYYSPA